MIAVFKCDVLLYIMPLKKLTKQEIASALGRLSELAASEGVRLEMTLYGGRGHAAGL